MKNVEGKNRISSIYPSPRPITPSAEDLEKQELEYEMRKVEKELTEEFSIEQNTYTNPSSLFQSETKKLKIMLNKLTCSNKVKSDKLESLKNLFTLNQKEMQNQYKINATKCTIIQIKNKNVNLCTLMQISAN